MAVDATLERFKFIKKANQRHITSKSRTPRLLPNKTANLLLSCTKENKAIPYDYVIIAVINMFPRDAAIV